MTRSGLTARADGFARCAVADEKAPGYWDGYKRNLAALMRAQRFPCPIHGILPADEANCVTCARNGAYERAARLAEDRYTVTTEIPGTIVSVKPQVDTAAAAHIAEVTHRLIWGETLYRPGGDDDMPWEKISWTIYPTGHVVAGEGWEPIVDGDKMLTGFNAITEGPRCSQCQKPGRLCHCTGGPWPDFSRPAAVDAEGDTFVATLVYRGEPR